MPVLSPELKRRQQIIEAVNNYGELLLAAEKYKSRFFKNIENTLLSAEIKDCFLDFYNMIAVDLTIMRDFLLELEQASINEEDLKKFLQENAEEGKE